MNLKYVVGGVLVAVVLVGSLGAAFYTGVGPAPGGESGDPIDEFPTETESESAPAEDDGAEGTESAQESDEDAGGTESDQEPDDEADASPFLFGVDDVEECGQTCRDVTATVYNNQNEPASEVTVYTRIFAGENNTDADDVVWEGTEDVGTLDAGASHTTTERVDLSLQQAFEIERNDGWITILTTVESDDETVTFSDSEKVA